MTKGRGRKKGKQSASRPIVIKGKGPLNAALSSTSAVGAFTANRFEIDTTLCPSWGQLGQVFAKWRVRKLKFHFSTLKSTTTEGSVGIMILPDPGESTPSTTSAAMSNEFARFGCIHSNLSLTYKPREVKWLFTRDSVLTEDRIEMPGDVVYWTENTTASYVPGVPWLEYHVEFDQVVNSSVAPMGRLGDGRSLSVQAKRHTGVKSQVSDNNNLSQASDDEVPPLINGSGEVSMGTELDHSRVTELEAMVKFLVKAMADLTNRLPAAVDKTTTK